MMKAGVHESWLDESQAMELAAMSEGSWLTRFKTTSKLGYAWRSFSHYSINPALYHEIVRDFTIGSGGGPQLAWSEHRLFV